MQSNTRPVPEGFRKIQFDEKTVLLVKPFHSDAAAVLCDVDETITAEHEHSALLDKKDEIEKAQGEEAAKKFIYDNNATWEIIKNKPFNGSAAKIKSSIQTLHAQQNVFCTVSFTDFIDLQAKTLQERLQLNEADYLICNLEQVLGGQAQAPQFTVIQDPDHPKPQLIIMVGGCPQDEEKVTKMSPDHHIDWAVKLLTLCGFSGNRDKLLYFDDSTRQKEAATQGDKALKKENVFLVKTVEDGSKGEHWDHMVTRAKELAPLVSASEQKKTESDFQNPLNPSLFPATNVKKRSAELALGTEKEKQASAKKAKTPSDVEMDPETPVIKPPTPSSPKG